ncbi:HlyD family efflux transporter periplasmic adaptor subunit [uncultured Brevundimonas sp.]|uniref:HlyD family efflux transporter periplasmic adaptor subunit n=1 Tax=uncultured Brevundimonas sp. TaxID=213418 RepID=UPI0025DDD793|nr:HlyD family efflux transporter periplasmic adaptor subunit [uncultured Brevundimonas sp.]
MNRSFITLAVAALIALGGCGDDRRSGPLTYEGNVDVRQVSLAFEDTGRVAEMRVDEGARVQAGAVIAVLDTTTLKLQAAEAEAQIEVRRQDLLKLRNGARPEEIAQARARRAAAEADAQRAGGDLARLRAVATATEGKGVSAQDLDRAAREAAAAQARAAEQAEAFRLTQHGPRREDIAAAEAQLRAAEAQLALYRHQIERGELRAATDGVVRSRLLEVGDLASPQTPAYAISLLNPKWIRIYVPETELGRIREGMTAQVRTDSQPGQVIPGRVGYIASTAEFTPKSVQTEELRTSLVYEVRVTVTDPQNRLRLGQPVSVSIDADGQTR